MHHFLGFLLFEEPFSLFLGKIMRDQPLTEIDSSIFQLLDWEELGEAIILFIVPVDVLTLLNE